uniref:Uncharacterized protein n=1 Tax=Anopheles maculatus TaxID=74869 RepID=A0A182SF95_9DIPT
MDSEQNVIMEQDPAHDASRSDDQTEDASEPEMWSSSIDPPTGESLVEQLYRERRADLLGQLELAKQRKHPEYLKIVQRLQTELNNRLVLNEIERDAALASAHQDCLREKAAAEQEFAEKKAELMSKVIADLEQEKKTLRQEIDAMELTGDGMKFSPPTITRRLRQRRERANRETFLKRNAMLSAEEIEHDLELIQSG